MDRKHVLEAHKTTFYQFEPRRKSIRNDTKDRSICPNCKTFYCVRGQKQKSVFPLIENFVVDGFVRNRDR